MPQTEAPHPKITKPIASLYPPLPSAPPPRPFFFLTCVIWLPFTHFKWKEKAPSLQKCLGFRLLVYKSTMQLHNMQFASKIKIFNVTTNLKDLARDLDLGHKDPTTLQHKVPPAIIKQISIITHMTSNFKTCDIMRKKGIMYSLLL
jgi:hypothetical protein